MVPVVPARSVPLLVPDRNENAGQLTAWQELAALSGAGDQLLAATPDAVHVYRVDVVPLLPPPMA